MLPLFHKLTVEDCKDKDLPYEQHFPLFRENEFFRHDPQLERSTARVMEMLGRFPSFVGHRNVETEGEWEFAERAASKVYRAVRGEAPGNG